MNLRNLPFVSACAAVLWTAPAMADDLSRPLVHRAGSISSTDYPPAALRAGMQGETRTLITIGTDGRVSDCRIQKSSGSALLDAHSCALVTARFVFDPALDAKGRPVEAKAVQPVAWVMPESAPPSEGMTAEEAQSGSRF